MRLLGVDAGFAALGAVIIEDGTVLHGEAFRTAKTSKKHGLRVADDDAERCQQLARFLSRFIDEWRPAGAVVELPSGGAQGARAHRAMGMAAAVAAAVLELSDLPAEWVTPAEGKKAAAGRKDASKEDVQRGVRRAFQWPAGVSWPACEAEHIYDAAAAVLAASNGTLARALRRAAKAV